MDEVDGRKASPNIFRTMFVFFSCMKLSENKILIFFSLLGFTRQKSNNSPGKQNISPGFTRKIIP